MDSRLSPQDKALVDAAVTDPDGDGARTAQADSTAKQKRPQG
jgi:membrane fusion protein, multidrug efflux system